MNFTDGTMASLHKADHKTLCCHHLFHPHIELLVKVNKICDVFNVRNLICDIGDSRVF